MVLSSHMKSRIFSTCILEGLLQFVCGNALEKAVIYVKIYLLLMEQLQYQHTKQYYKVTLPLLNKGTLT